MKKLSIITVTLNCEDYIEETIKSVIYHSEFNEIEYIIIDGLSDDSTCQIINKYQKYLDHFISEKDNGIFHAMNKGTVLANCEWILYLNAGDKIDEKFIFKNIFESNNIALFYGNTCDIGIGIRKPFNLKYLKYGMIMACHQSMIFNKKILKSTLVYNLIYTSYNDFELVVRILRNNYTIQYIDSTISHYLGNGVSTIISFNKRINKLKIMLHHYGIIGIFRTLIYKLGYRP